jgi:peptide/nickel transport system substrate-binding protein
MPVRKSPGTAWLAACIGAGAIALAGATPAQAQAPAPGTVLKIALDSDIRSTEPGVNRDGNSDTVVANIVEGLVAFSENADVKPMLADSVAVSDDGKTYTFKLRDGVRFTNGEPLTSADVLWSWNFYMKPDTNWRCRADFDGSHELKVDSVETPDPRTVVYRLNQPYGLFLATLARPDCGGTGILNKASLKPDGTWDKPVATGPFMLGEWKRGQYVSLAKNPHYANRSDATRVDGFTGSKRPLVDEVRFMFIPDSATKNAAIGRGDIDVIWNLPYTDLKPLQQVPHVKVVSAPAMNLTALLMQTRDPVLSNVKLRQAIVHAIDVDQLVEAVGEGFLKPSTSLIPNTSSYYGDEQRQTWKYDPELAKELLQESGYKGQEISLVATKQFPISFNTAVIIQAMLQAVGINCRLVDMDWATEMNGYTTGKFQMLSFAYSARLDPALSYDMATGNKDKQPNKIWGNPQAVALVAKASIEADRAQRQADFDQLQKLFLADAPMLPLFSGLDANAIRDDIHGYTPWALKLPRGWEITKGQAAAR